MEDLRDTHETRLSLEILAVRAAATRFSDSDAAAARTALAEHVRLSKLGDIIASRQAHTEFHFAIYRAGGSRWLPRAIEPVWQNSERYRFGSRQTKARIEQTRREHQAILDACLAHDEAGCGGSAARAPRRRHAAHHRDDGASLQAVSSSNRSCCQPVASNTARSSSPSLLARCTPRSSPSGLLPRPS